MNFKGMSPLLSGVLYMTIIVTGILIVMASIYPKIMDLKEYSKITNTIKCARNMDYALSLLEKSSLRGEQEIECKIKNAKLSIKNDTMLFIFPHIDYLSLDIFKNEEYTLNEGVYVYDNGSYFLMGNKYLEVNFSKIYANNMINISQIINNIYYKKTSKNIDGSSLYFILNDDPSISIGRGYTIAERSGAYLKYGKIIAHVENDNAKYNLTFILYPSADYIIISVES